ncbi:D-glycero-alpha-D-manno-heptose-1,7-bisphosphate 7-phosphatase [Mycolicibacterium arenosum]|uniref:D,D-heptose 1,7-bisphosphate phosphatase n=1 Tax=Mycolicibacterium arenosum TaxID=2952157 RepID=A0ABT1M7X9_9MYCO|nr:HAD family hydrolase [Mycolicibacterium sp. CAU 1645]MCP9275281.1 HAD family hydrolase [Mycolicibacterium sp. CAU 1645]
MIRYIGADLIASVRRGLFLDRDGVLNRRAVDGYVTDPRDFELLNVTLDAARWAQSTGAALVVVTNQGAIGRGLATEADVLAVHAVLMDALASQGVHLDAIYTCPHHPAAIESSQRSCKCRKPAPGLIVAAAADLKLDLSQSILIGDQMTDMKAATAAGIPRENAVLVDVNGDRKLLKRTLESIWKTSDSMAEAVS